MTRDHYTAHVGCEAPWVVDGIEGRGCDASATRTIQLEADVLLVCDRRTVDLGDFEKYWNEHRVAP